MAIGFNIQFRINEKTESRVIRLTDTSTGFTITKGIFSIVYPDGTSYSHTDLNNPDITSSGAYYDYQVSTDIYNNALTGQYVITFVGQDAGLNTQTIQRTIDFNWIKPTKSIINLSDTMIPEVKFQDSTVYTSSGSFTGVLTSRTFNVLMPTTSAVTGTTVTAVSNIIDAVVSTNYYEGVYTPKSDVVVTYTHNTLSTSLTVLYTALLQKDFSIKKAPTRQDLITRINLFRTQVDAYKESNDTQFETLSEVYDILIALYLHLIERAQTSTLDGSQDILMEIINILDKYTPYTYQSGPISAFFIQAFGLGTVTSIGVTMPSAFTVSNSPVTTSGTIGVTGAGSTLQYVDGTGALQTFPTVLPANRMMTIGRNATGSTLYKGIVVYISGSTGNRPNFVKAIAGGESTSAGTFGVVFSDIANNTDGYVVTIGTIDTLDTRSNATNPFTTDTLNDGDTIYLSPTTAGYVTNVKPYAPNHIVYIGKVVRTTPNDGTIVYRIQNGYELDEVHDVQVGSYVNKDILYRDTTLNLWKNASIATVLGYTPYNATNPAGYITGITSGNVTTALGYTPYNATNPAGYITGITSGNVTTALGYTPYNATNPSGYISGITSGNVTTALGYTPYNATNPSGYISANQTITLSGAVTGSGATAITTTLANSVVGIANLSATGTPSATTYLRGDNTWATVVASGGTVTSVAALTLGTIGTDLTSTVANGTTTPVITLNVPTASATNRGALSSTDWTTFNNKQGAITLTTTGSSGSATFTTNTLNIPTYTLSGLGGQASSTNLTSLSGLSYVSASFVKMTAAGTFSLDTNTYYLASNPSGYTANAGTVTTVAALTIGTTGTDLTSTVVNGNTTPVITLNVPTASATNRGALSSGDWTTFNSKQGAITLTTTGTTGAATFIGNTLNIPQYVGGVSSFNTRTGAITLTSGDVTGALTYTPVPPTRTITINGTTYDLSADRSWTVSGGGGTNVGSFSRTIQTFTATASQTTFTISGGYTAGYIDVYVNGVRLTGADYTASNGTTVVMGTGLLVGDIVDVAVYGGIALSGTAPISFNTTTGEISISQATMSTNGYLSSTDWNTFNGKQGTITLTTTGTSGAATLVGNTLNIPNYSTGGGSGTVTTVSVVSANGFAGSVATATSTPAITISTTVSGVLKGNGTAISAAVANTDYLAVNNPVYTGILGTGTLTYSPANLFLYAQDAQNSYIQAVFQNSNSQPQASADIVLNNNLSTDTSHYGDFGMNSSNFNGTGSLSLPNAVYLTATTGDLVLGTTTSNSIRFVINDGATDAAMIKTTSQLQLPAYTTTTSFTGTVAGYLAFDSSGNIITTAAPSFGYTVTTQSTTYSVTATSGTLIVKGNTTSAGFTITLPTAVGNTATIVIKKVAAANILTIGTTSSQTIDGATTAQIKVSDASITLISDNANWQII